MTNKSAIVIIKAMITTHKSLEAQGINSDVPFDEESIEALNMAIDSLKKPNIHGHWEPKYPTREEMIYCQERYFCSNCKGYVVDRIERLEFNFCPNCGADMREPKGEKGTE